MARFDELVGRLAAECSLMKLLGVHVAGEWTSEPSPRS